MEIPSWTYKYDLAAFRQEYIAAFERVLDSGQLLFGSELKNLETQFADLIGTKYGIGCDNATNALFLALKVLGIGEGDEVICIPTTAIPTISAIIHAGAHPILVDVDKYGQIDVQLIEKAITPNTKAVVPVHLYGYPSNVPLIRAICAPLGIHIVEDCSQAHGASISDQSVGSLGDISCFSFYPTKPLGAFGDAGIICTDSDYLDDLLRKLRFYGISSGYVAEVDGYNSRLDEVQAAILCEKIPRLCEMRNHRAVASQSYESIVSSTIRRLKPPPYASAISGYLIPFLFLSDRNSMQETLRDAGVGLNISYKTPIHLMPAYKDLGYAPGSFPVAEFICEHIFSPPIFDYIPLGLVRRAAESIAAVDDTFSCDPQVLRRYEQLFID